MAKIVEKINIFRGKSLDVQSGVRKRKEVWRIKLDSKVMQLEQVELLAKFKIGDQQGAYTITSLMVAPKESNQVFDITLSLEVLAVSIHLSTNANGGETAEVKFGKWFTEARVDHDTETGAAIETSAHAPFAQSTIRRVPQLTVRVSVRSRQEHIARTANIGMVSKGAFELCGITFPAYTGMLYDFDLEPNYDEDGNLYHIAHYEFRQNLTEDKDGNVIGYKLEVPDRGFQRLDGGGEPITIFYKDGTKPSVPVNLSGGQPKLPITDPPDYLIFTVDRLVDNFSGFGLPTNYPYRRSLR